MTWSNITDSLVATPTNEGVGSNSNDDRTPRSSSIIAGRRSGRRTTSATNSEEVKERSSKRARSSARRRRPSGKTSDDATVEVTEEEVKPLTAARKNSVKRAAKEIDLDSSQDQEKSIDEAAVKPRRRRTQRKETVADMNAIGTDSASNSTIALGDAASSSAWAGKRQTTDAGDIKILNDRIEEQNNALHELRAGLLALGQQLDRTAQKPRLGVFVDVPNLMYGQEPDETPINMGKLLDLLRNGRDIVRATAYSPISDNPAEPLEEQKFVAPFVPYEYRIVTKPLKRFADGSIKGNFDVEMAIDMLTMADRLDVIAIVSGDADFARAVEVVQTRGVRVEVVAFAGSSSLEMRSLADQYIELGSVIDQVT